MAGVPSAGRSSSERSPARIGNIIIHRFNISVAISSSVVAGGEEEGPGRIPPRMRERREKGVGTRGGKSGAVYLLGLTT